MQQFLDLGRFLLGLMRQFLKNFHVADISKICDLTQLFLFDTKIW